MNWNKIFNAVYYGLLFIIAVLVFSVLFPETLRNRFITGGGNKKVATYYIHESKLDPDFKSITSDILKNSGWRKKFDIKEINSAKSADINIYLRSDESLEEYHDKNEFYEDGITPIRFSITYQGQKIKPEIWINYKNWQGVPQSGLSFKKYREYVINHEFGHGLGFDHQKCNPSTVQNGTCPVMYQSTRGCKNFRCGSQPIIGIDDQEKIDVAYLRWT